MRALERGKNPSRLPLRLYTRFDLVFFKFKFGFSIPPEKTLFSSHMKCSEY